jgi:hypothetical protein
VVGLLLLPNGFLLSAFFSSAFFLLTAALDAIVAADAAGGLSVVV